MCVCGGRAGGNNITWLVRAASKHQLLRDVEPWTALEKEPKSREREAHPACLALPGPCEEAELRKTLPGIPGAPSHASPWDASGC